MDEEFISKKELLETFGISYGALYRWKRMGLIPEAWFLRRSTSTGQETFFRRDQICQRVRLILDNKEHQTLDELAASLAEKHQTVLARRKLIIGLWPQGISPGGGPQRRGGGGDAPRGRTATIKGGHIMNDIMDMKISGSSAMPGGEYRTVSISGSGKVQGSLRCESLRCSGSARVQGDVDCAG